MNTTHTYSLRRFLARFRAKKSLAALSLTGGGIKCFVINRLHNYSIYKSVSLHSVKSVLAMWSFLCILLSAAVSLTSCEKLEFPEEQDPKTRVVTAAPQAADTCTVEVVITGAKWNRVVNIGFGEE